MAWMLPYVIFSGEPPALQATIEATTYARSIRKNYANEFLMLVMLRKVVSMKFVN